MLGLAIDPSTDAEVGFSDGTFQDSFCGVSGHRKPVEAGKADTREWNDTRSGSIISQLAAGAAGTDFIWEILDTLVRQD